MILVAILFLYFCWPSSEKRLIPISVFALIAGVLFEGKRLVGKWKALIYMVISSFSLSFVSFLPGKHEHHYNFDLHIEFWPYSFILIFLLISLCRNEKNIIPRLSEGNTLIQSLAIIYWIIDLGIISLGNGFILALLAIGSLFSIFSIVNALTDLPLTKNSRFILSLWSSIIMMFFAIDNIIRVYQNDAIETVSSLSIGLYIGFQYFLLGISSIYFLQNLFMVIGFLPGKTTFFNKQYFEDIKELKKKHIDRYSACQCNKIHSFFCIVLACTFFSVNYYYRLIPRNMAIWILFLIVPYFINIYEYFVRTILTSKVE